MGLRLSIASSSPAQQFRLLTDNHQTQSGVTSTGVEQESALTKEEKEGEKADEVEKEEEDEERGEDNGEEGIDERGEEEEGE